MGNLTDKQLLKELRERLEERKKFEDEFNELNREYLSVTKKISDSEALKSHYFNISNEIVNPFTS